MTADRIPRRLRLVHNGDCWVVLAWYRHFWPNGDSCTVHYGGETRRAAIVATIREVLS